MDPRVVSAILEFQSWGSWDPCKMTLGSSDAAQLAAFFPSLGLPRKETLGEGGWVPAVNICLVFEDQHVLRWMVSYDLTKWNDGHGDCNLTTPGLEAFLELLLRPQKDSPVELYTEDRIKEFASDDEAITRLIEPYQSE